MDDKNKVTSPGGTCSSCHTIKDNYTYLKLSQSIVRPINYLPNVYWTGKTEKEHCISEVRHCMSDIIMTNMFEINIFGRASLRIIHLSTARPVRGHKLKG